MKHASTKRSKPARAEIDDTPEIDLDDPRWKVLGRGGRARAAAVSLRQLREATGKTQVDISRKSGIQQADVSRTERRDTLDDALVATLRRYVGALGGELELVATFGDRRFVIVAGGPEDGERSRPRLARAARR